MSVWRFIPCALAVALSGCSIDGYGLIAASVVQADGAYVVQTYSLGANVRTRADDAGASLGASKRSYVFPLASSEKLAAGWHWLWISLPSRSSLIQRAETIGVDLRSMFPGPSVDVGYSETTILARVDNDLSATMRLTYRSGAPELTRLQYCEGPKPC